MTLPVFGVIHSRFVLQPSQTALWREIEGDHIDILQHIVASDGAAAEAMHQHLVRLNAVYRVMDANRPEDATGPAANAAVAAD